MTRAPLTQVADTRLAQVGQRPAPRLAWARHLRAVSDGSASRAEERSVVLLPVRPVRLAACVVLAGSVLLGSAAAAAAHDALVGSDPADGAALDAAPAQVVLTFSADHLEAGSAVTVTG